MPVNVDQMTAEVSIVEGELPFSEAQLERLVALVAQRLERRARDASESLEATRFRSGVIPASSVED
jgi:hypothetical protein